MRVRDRALSKGMSGHITTLWRGRIEAVVEDEQGNEVRTPLMSLAVGVLTAEDGPFTDIREITEAAAEARRRGVK